MEMMVYCFSCQILMPSSFVSTGATLAPVSGFTAGCCHQKYLCYLNLPQTHPFLQQNGKGAAGISQSLPKDLLLKGQGGFGTWCGQLFWHSGVVTASPANLWLFQLADIYPVLPLEDKGTVSSLQYRLQGKRVMVGIHFSSGHLAQNALNLFKLHFWVVVRMQKPAPAGSWEHELFCLGVEAAVCIS